MSLAKKAKLSTRKSQPKSKTKANAKSFPTEFYPDPDPSPILTNFLRPESRFNILPFNTFHTIISMSADILPMNYTKRYYFIKRYFPMDSPKVFSSPRALETSSSIPGRNTLLPISPINTGWSIEKSIEIRRANNKIMKCRAAFRKLLHHMRLYRLERVNTEDIVTGEIPKHPVNMVDWNEKKIYTFEAYTLMKDITERLLHHEGFFEYPQSPRNPFTNLPLTQAQTISVWNSVSRAGIPVSSAFTLFRNVSFDLKKFWDNNETFLRLNSLRKTFKEARSYDYTERMLDFIAFSYTVESIDCPLNSFKNAIKKYPNHHLIKKWSRLCERYYEADILYAGNIDRIKNMKDIVLNETYHLLYLDRAIITLNAIIENISQTEQVGGTTSEQLDGTSDAINYSLLFLIEPEP